MAFNRETTYGDGVFALSEGVPLLDGAVSGARDDLTVVSRESNAQDILLVVVELSGGLASSFSKQNKLRNVLFS